MEELVTGAGGDEGVGEVILGETSPCSLKELSIRAGISGGQDAGEGHLWVNGNGKKMMLEEQSQPGHLCLSLQCMIPEGLEDHIVMNGFSESFCLDEEEEEEGPGMERQDLTGTTAASSTTVVQDLNLVEIQDEAFDEVNPGGDCIVTRSSLSLPQKNCTSDMVTGGLSNLTLSNGVLNSTEDLTCLNTSAVFSSPALLGHKPSLNHIECFDFKKANGGVHITSTNPRATCDCPDSDNSFRDNTNIHVNLEAGQTNGKRSDVSMEICQDNSPVSPLFQDNSPTPGSSAKCSAPNFLSPAGLNSDSPISGAESDEEEEEELSELSLPVRPHSLRTNLGVPLSLSCDATPLTPDEDGDFYFINEDCRNAVEIAGRRQSAPDKLPDLSNQNDSSEPKLLPKRFGIADFFTRSLFSRKAKEPKAVSHNASGWRLFGKTAARDADQTTDFSSAPIAQQEDQADDSGASPCSLSAGRRKKLEFEPLSTTALILEDRPANLPAKSEEETQRHKLEYEEMVAGAKKREMKDAQKKKRQMKERHRQEDSISNAMVIWNNEILPNWDTMKGTRRVRDLWWQGLPPSVRGRVWSLAIGNELNITPELYEIFLCRAKEKWRSYSETSSVNNDSESDGGASLADRESSLDLIKLDISRTFPSLFIFQRGGPYHDLLHSVLGAYTCYRPDIGYVQGMSFIAAVLILNLEEADAFITFANLLNKPCQMAFFRVDHDLMLKYFAAFEVFFEENLPRLFGHFQTNNLTPDLYLIDWIFTLFSKSLPLDVACRVWDVFCRDGEESLFRTGLGILRLYEDVLLQMDFIHIAQFLTRLPDDLQSHTLFNAMANTHMISRNRRWAQVFSALTKDGNKETERNNSPALRS